MIAYFELRFAYFQASTALNFKEYGEEKNEKHAQVRKYYVYYKQRNDSRIDIQQSHNVFT